MKSSIITALAILAFFHEIKAAEPVQVFTPDEQGAVSVHGAPAHVVALINQLRSSDMKKWLLSQEKGSKWLVTRATIIDSDLISVRLSDGNGAEEVLFDRDNMKNWTIIRRAPIGDWKPQDERLGDRLSALPFPNNEAQQDADDQLPARAESEAE